MKAVLIDTHKGMSDAGSGLILEPGAAQFFQVSSQGLAFSRSPVGNRWIAFTYAPRFSAWQVSFGDALRVLVNRENLRSTKLLADGDSIAVDDAKFRIEYHCDPPLWQGVEANTIPLGAEAEILVGRVTEGDAAIGIPKLGLDRHTLSISREHFKLCKTAEGWQIVNFSDFGTEINSRLIHDTQNLVFGDRIKAGDYIFQFEGGSMRRIDHSDDGTVVGQDLAVIVPDRSTGTSKLILDAVTVGAKSGDFVGILGGSGQGKSTLLTALCGLRKCSTGQSLIGGHPSVTLNTRNPGAIGYVPQDDIVHLELTVEMALYYSLRLRLRLNKTSRRGLIDRTIEALGLTEHRHKRVDQLSGGQRKRVSIAIELLSKPAILFLDEPSSGLDPATEKTLMELLQSLALNNLTVICTTHVLQNAFLFDRLWYIHSGKLIFSGDASAAREFFLDQGATSGTSHQASATIGPVGQLERIYSTVINGRKSAEHWQDLFQASEFGQAEQQFVGALTSRAAPTAPTTLAQPRALTKFLTLMRRQATLLSASKLNLLFLGAQVLIIGLLVAWVSDDFGLRNFLGIIAAMWFGCSNGAQEIVKEKAIFAREKLCGLGSNTYALSKLTFHGILAGFQALLLFLVVTFGGSYFHPEEFDPEHFLLRYAERDHPVVADDRAVDDDDDAWMPVDEDLPDSGEEMAEIPPEVDLSGAPEASGVNVPGSTLLWITKVFQLSENLLDSGPKPLTMSDHTPIMGEDRLQLTSQGEAVPSVLAITIGFRLLAYLCAALVGVALGLAVSTLVQTPIQAVMWVPLLLIPQILFGGFVINVPEMPTAVRKVAALLPSFACQRLADVSYLFGREVPALTNKTKTPQFLTTDGSKDEVTWTEEGRSVSQSFERVSDANTAWQNLVIEPRLLGQHKQQRNARASFGSFDYPESITTRRDVRLDKGTPYLSLNAVWRPLITLGTWILACYCTIILALWKRRTA